MLGYTGAEGELEVSRTVSSGGLGQDSCAVLGFLDSGISKDIGVQSWGVGAIALGSWGIGRETARLTPQRPASLVLILTIP